MEKGPPRAVHQQPHLQRRRAEPLLRERHLAVGLGLGPVPRPRRSACATSTAARRRRSRSTRTTRSSRFQNDLGAIDFARTPAAPGTGQDARRGSRSNTLSSFIDALARVRRDADAARLAARRARSTARSANNSASLLPARTATSRRPTRRGDADTAPAMDLMGQLVAHPRERRRRRRRAGEREHRAHRDPDAVRARAQPDRRRRLPDSAVERAQVPDRAPRRRRGEQYITYNEFLPALGVQPRPVPRLRPEREPGALERVRDGRLPRAQHGARRVRADGARRDVQPAHQLDRVPGAGDRRRRSGGKNVTLVIPLGVAFGNPDLLEPVGLGPTLEGLAASASTRTTSRSTTRCAASCSRSRSPASPTRPSAATPVVDPSCFSAVAGPRRDRHPARPRPRHPDLQPAARRVRARAEATRSRRSPASAPTDFPRSKLDQPPRPDRRSRHPRLHEAEGRRRRRPSRSSDDEAQEDAVVGRPAHDARRAPEGDLRAERRQGRRVRRDGVRAARRAAPSSASCSSRSGRSSSRRCATATGSST